MHLSKGSIERFKILYLKYFGEALSEDEATQRASSLLEVYRVTYGLPSIEDDISKRESSS